MNNERLSALLTLLLDDDDAIASLAMEQILTEGPLASQTVAEYQESHDPQLRQRIHQISSILARRQARREFVQALADEKLTLWEGIVQIHSLYELSCNVRELEQDVDNLVRDLRKGKMSTPRLAEFMREKEFTVPSEDILDVDLFLIQRVLTTRYGSAAILSVLAQQLATRCRWPFTVVLHAGRFCLMDGANLLLNPSEGWHISKLKSEDRIHPCSRRDVLLAILCQLFLIALIEGQLRDLHHFGSLLTSMNENDVSFLPFPLGEPEEPAVAPRE